MRRDLPRCQRNPPSPLAFGSVFESLREAREATESWLREYNVERPHGSLGGLTPSKFFELGKQEEREAA
jgi:transposase InsO family protein